MRACLVDSPDRCARCPLLHTSRFGVNSLAARLRRDRETDTQIRIDGCLVLRLLLANTVGSCEEPCFGRTGSPAG